MDEDAAKRAWLAKQLDSVNPVMGAAPAAAAEMDEEAAKREWLAKLDVDVMGKAAAALSQAASGAVALADLSAEGQDEGRHHA